MSQSVQLSAMLRTERLRDLKDALPAVVYGSGIETTSLALKRSDFEKVFAAAGESGLIALKLDDGRELPVIIKDFQNDVLKQRIIHVDFYKVNMDEKVVAEVSLHFIGEAPAVKNHGGIVIEHFDTLEIECLPADLIQKIDIDLSTLENINDAIHVKDIVLPTGVVAKQDAEEIVVNVVEPKKVEEEAPVVSAVEGETEPTAEGETEVKVAEGKENKEVKAEEKTKEKK